MIVVKIDAGQEDMGNIFSLLNENYTVTSITVEEKIPDNRPVPKSGQQGQDLAQSLSDATSNLRENAKNRDA